MPLTRRHQDFLDTAIELLAYNATVTLSKKQLRYIYEVERLGKNSWRDLFERIPDGINPGKILIVEEDDNIILIRSDLATQFKEKL